MTTRTFRAVREDGTTFEGAQFSNGTVAVRDIAAPGVLGVTMWTGLDTAKEMVMGDVTVTWFAPYVSYPERESE